MTPFLVKVVMTTSLAVMVTTFWWAKKAMTNFTVVKGAYVAGTPSFFGANPGEVRQGPRKGTRVLGREEDLGRELVKWLLASGKKEVVFTESPPREILTAQESKVEPLEDSR